MLLGPKRYTGLRRGLPNASPNVLSERLRELEDAGVVRRRKLPPPAGSRVYELTDRGLGLEEIVISLGRWGARSPTPPGDAPILSADSIILALRGLFDRDAAHGLHAGYELRLGEDRFHIEVADGEMDVIRGNADRPDATIDTDPDTLDAVLWKGRPLADALLGNDDDRGRTGCGRALPSTLPHARAIRCRKRRAREPAAHALEVDSRGCRPTCLAA